MSDNNPVDPTATSAQPKKRWTRLITPALALVAALAIGGVAGAFIGQGTAAGAGPTANGPGGFSANGGGPRFQGGAGGPGGGLTAGTIESIDGDTITVKLEDGTTVKVTTDADTTVTETTDATVGDLATGDTVTVFGAKGADGSVAADSIAEGQARAFGGPVNSAG